MTWWQALILGIVEGLTEYLPVSSTGHLILTGWLLGLGEDPEKWHAAFTFHIVIQIGAILAVLGMYRKRVGQITLGVFGRDDQGKQLAANLLIAFAPAAILGPLLNDMIRSHLNGPWPVVGALFVGAWLMLAVAFARVIHRMDKTGREIHSIDWRIALLIGFGQCIAMWPGTSRSMMTIVTALMLGVRAKDAAEFSFLLGLITLTAATGYEFLYSGATMINAFGITPLIIGLIASTVSAAIAIKWFVGFLNRHGLAPFGWYRLALATAIAALLITGVLTVPTEL